MVTTNDLKQFQPISSMPIYTTSNINYVLNELKKLPSGIRRSAMCVYNVIEMHCNSETQECYVSQQRIAEELDLSREYVCKIIKALTSIGLIFKIRQGLNKVNKMILTAKKSFLEALKKLRQEKVQQDTENNEIKQTDAIKTYSKQNYNKKSKGYKYKTTSRLAENIESTYGSIANLEAKLLGRC